MSYDEEGPLRGQHVDDGEHEPRCEEKKYYGFIIKFKNSLMNNYNSSL